MQATITEKGQVTIPVEIRRKLSLVAGSKLEFDPNALFVKATKAVKIEQMEGVIGRYSDRFPEDAKTFVEDTRG
jgi:AbrB family looped-hinge helix DNA binding protein